MRPRRPLVGLRATRSRLVGSDDDAVALTAGVVSGLVGDELPGDGATISELHLLFAEPARPGEVVTATVLVAETGRAGTTLTVEVVCDDGRTTATGHAVARAGVPESPAAVTMR